MAILHLALLQTQLNLANMVSTFHSTDNHKFQSRLLARCNRPIRLLAVSSDPAMPENVLTTGTSNRFAKRIVLRNVSSASLLLSDLEKLDCYDN